MSNLHQKPETQLVSESLAYTYAQQLAASRAVMPETLVRFTVDLKRALDCSLPEAQEEVRAMERTHNREHLRGLGLKFYN